LANQPLWPAAFKFKGVRIRGSFRTGWESERGNELANEFGRHEPVFQSIDDHAV
jgi:hypothetical protein